MGTADNSFIIAKVKNIVPFCTRKFAIILAELCRIAEHLYNNVPDPQSYMSPLQLKEFRAKHSYYKEVPEAEEAILRNKETMQRLQCTRPFR